MFFTKPLFDSSSVFRGSRRLEPKKWFFKEILPLCSKNAVVVKRMKPAGAACTQELQAFFGCLKKWEFDDLRCLKEHDVYINCIRVYEKQAAEYKKNMTTEAVSSDSKNVGAAQINRLLKQWPQPDLGTSPYRKMKRLPTQSYSDDLFHRMKSKGKMS